MGLRLVLNGIMESGDSRGSSRIHPRIRNRVRKRVLAHWLCKPGARCSIFLSLISHPLKWIVTLSSERCCEDAGAGGVGSPHTQSVPCVKNNMNGDTPKRSRSCHPTGVASAVLLLKSLKCLNWAK